MCVCVCVGAFGDWNRVINTGKILDRKFKILTQREKITMISENIYEVKQ